MDDESSRTFPARTKKTPPPRLDQTVARTQIKYSQAHGGRTNKNNFVVQKYIRRRLLEPEMYFGLAHLNGGCLSEEYAPFPTR